MVTDMPLDNRPAHWTLRLRRYFHPTLRFASTYSLWYAASQVQPDYVPAIDLRSAVRAPRETNGRKIILPAKYHIVLYVGTQPRMNSRKVDYKRVGKYSITALTPAGVHYVPKALREFIKSLDCAQLVPAEPEKPAEKGKAA
jgi:hypothetical protein